MFNLDSGTMLIHLRMSGDLRLAPAGTELGPYEHTRFELENAWELRFSDARKFGRVGWYRDSGEVLDRLGPEPLDAAFTATKLWERLQKKSRMLKPLLLDQKTHPLMWPFMQLVGLLKERLMETVAVETE